MNTSKLSQDELDQLDFDGDLTAPEYDSFNMHGNLSVQLPGGAVALCLKTSVANQWDFYTAGSLGPTATALGGGVQYQSQDFFVQGGGGGGTNQGNVQVQLMRTF